MKRWVWSGIVIAAGVIVIACGERRTELPSGPMASVTALTAVPACDLSGTNSLVSQYFNSTDAKTVRTLLDQIGAAGPGSVTARDRGFDIIAIIARNAQTGTGGTASAGSSLINKITACMFGTLAELPENYPEDYTVAITTAMPGALGVRGGAADAASDPVLSRGSFSGVAPQLGVTWATTLGGNPAPARIAFYGRPGSTPQTYDWKVLPRNATFAPAAIVGVCVDPNTATTSMLHEEHVGLLTFGEAYFLDASTCGGLASRRVHGSAAAVGHGGPELHGAGARDGSDYRRHGRWDADLDPRRQQQRRSEDSARHADADDEQRRTRYLRGSEL